MGVHARSWQGWQIPIQTDNAHGAARILDIDGAFLIKRFGEGQVAVIAGFQGIGPDNRIATLGRGGSDTSAVAIAAAVKADRCDIYTDVDGVYTTDPRIEPKARRLAKISFEEMLEMASLGAKVLQVRSVELAMVHKVRTFVRSSFDDPGRARNGGFRSIRPERSFATRKKSWNSRSSPASPMPRTKPRSRCAASPTGRASRPAIFGPLAEANINVDMIVQNISEDGTLTDMTFTVPSGDVDKALAVLDKAARPTIGFDVVQSRSRHVEGLGHRHRHAQPCRRRRHRLQGAGRQGHQHPAPSPPPRSRFRS